MESWNHNFKVEAIHGERFLTRSDTKHQVFHNIEVYYNHKRRHSTLAMLVQKILKLKKSLNYVSVKSGQDQVDNADREVQKGGLYELINEFLRDEH